MKLTTWLTFCFVIFVLQVSSQDISLKNETIKMIMLGDWGINSKGQDEVCTAMEEYASRIDFNFIISLGDNFYLSGVDSIEDVLFQKIYENVYNKKKNLQKLKWWSILGNHDW
jgi:tartrate-resistant acid phosphatase type 5